MKTIELDFEELFFRLLPDPETYTQEITVCKDLQKHTRKLPGKDLSRLRSFYKQKSYDVIRKKTLILGVENVLVEIRKDQEILRRKRTSTIFRRDADKQ